MLHRATWVLYPKRWGYGLLLQPMSEGKVLTRRRHYLLFEQTSTCEVCISHDNEQL
jgi:hypothetical protein